MAGNCHLVEVEPIEERKEVTLIVGVAVRVGVLGQAVSSKVEGDDTNAFE